MTDLKERGAKIIIGEFYMNAARHIMCEAYKAKMTQKQGFVWFLPGWFEKDWYDIDSLAKDKRRRQTGKQKELYGTINMFGKTQVGELPSCSTKEMVEALNGHFSLVHAHFGPDTNKVVGGWTVQEWKKEVKKRWIKTKENYNNLQKSTDNMTSDINKTEFEKTYQLNKYSGYVYDAVWLYAYALDTLINKHANKSFIQNWHSERTVKEFVSVIRNTSFSGVSGWINFNEQPSRLSNVRILQWLRKRADMIQKNEIGLYLPNYERKMNNSVIFQNGKMEVWKAHLIKWQTIDGTKPLDNPKECGVLSTFATKLDIECQLAITVIFIINFSLLLLFILILFLLFRRR